MSSTYNRPNTQKRQFARTFGSRGLEPLADLSDRNNWDKINYKKKKNKKNQMDSALELLIKVTEVKRETNQGSKLHKSQSSLTKRKTEEEIVAMEPDFKRTFIIQRVETFALCTENKLINKL